MEIIEGVLSLKSLLSFYFHLSYLLDKRKFQEG